MSEVYVYNLNRANRDSSLLSFNDSTKLPDASTQGLQSTIAEQNTLLSEWKDTSFQTGTIMLS
jgi:hypothetical protein